MIATTGRSAAIHILNGIKQLIEDQGVYIGIAKRVMCEDAIKTEEARLDELCLVAAAMESAIDDGSFD